MDKLRTGNGLLARGDRLVVRAMARFIAQPCSTFAVSLGDTNA
jgi:hypothetical protein